MCTNSAGVANTLECYMDDLLDCFEDFIQRSLIIISVALGALVVMLGYMLKIITDRNQGAALNNTTGMASTRTNGTPVNYAQTSIEPSASDYSNLSLSENIRHTRNNVQLKSENTHISEDTHISDSTQRKSDSTQRKSDSSQRKSDSSQRKSDSSQRKSDSSQRQSDKTQQISESNQRNLDSGRAHESSDRTKRNSDPRADASSVKKEFNTVTAANAKTNPMSAVPSSDEKLLRDIGLSSTRSCSRRSILHNCSTDRIAISSAPSCVPNHHLSTPRPCSKYIAIRSSCCSMCCADDDRR